MGSFGSSFLFMSMKKKLLLTMGCSITEGVGCYDYSKMEQIVPYYEIPIEKRNFQLDRFHEFGWPNRVGKKLGFDKVVNLGAGGASNISQLYKFLGVTNPQILDLKKEYDLYLIWMMTDPLRFSFSSKKLFHNINPTLLRDDLEKEFMNHHIEKSLIPEKDQAFIMLSSELIFKQFGIRYVFTSWNKSFEIVYKYFETPNYLNPNPHFTLRNFDPKYKSRVCNHPNEAGYELLANQITEWAKEYHPDFCVGEPKNEIEWEYLDYHLDKLPFLKSLEKSL